MVIVPSDLTSTVLSCLGWSGSFFGARAARVAFAAIRAWVG